jgi:hypothetical protein
MADGQQNLAPDTLAKALLRFQQLAPRVLKSAQGNRGKYAPLDVVLDAVRPQLSACGIVVTQITKTEGDFLWVETRLIHAESGEAQTSVYPVGHVAKTHQELGGGLTYARRYALLAVLNLCPAGEDKDGERAGRAAKRPSDGEPSIEALMKAAQELRVKLIGAVSADDLARIWQRNSSLRSALADRDPDTFRKIERVFSDRVTDLKTREGDANDAR